jgi:starvation-inducible DNA-binding protein
MLQTSSHKTTNLNQMTKLAFHNSLVNALQKQIANGFNLYMNYKHYHWQSNGPMSRDLHIVFDEFANEVYSSVEELSERVRKIGQNRVRVREFSKNASVKPAGAKSDLRKMIEEAYCNSVIVITEIREIISKTKKADPVSAGVFQKFLRMHEKHQWWLRRILDNRQGLTSN